MLSSAVHHGTDDLNVPRVMGQAALKHLRKVEEINSCLLLRSSAVLTGLNQKGFLLNSAAVRSL